MLEAATGALARLDAETLVELERRAQALLTNGARAAALPEMAAQHRVFAGLVQATGENLGILERVGRGAYGAAQLRIPWVL